MRPSDPVDRFVLAVGQHHGFTLKGDSTQANREVEKFHRAARELLQGGDGAIARFAELLDHLEPAIRCMAAAYLLECRTNDAVAALKPLAKRRDIIGFGAIETLKRYERGDLAIR